MKVKDLKELRKDIEISLAAQKKKYEYFKDMGLRNDQSEEAIFLKTVEYMLALADKMENEIEREKAKFEGEIESLIREQIQENDRYLRDHFDPPELGEKHIDFKHKTAYFVLGQTIPVSWNTDDS